MVGKLIIDWNQSQSIWLIHQFLITIIKNNDGHTVD